MAERERNKSSIIDVAVRLVEKITQHTEVSPEEKKDQIAKRTEEMFNKARIEREKKVAEEFAKNVKKKGAQHVTTSMREWGEKNKYPSSSEVTFEKQLAQSKKTLEVALSASKAKPDWLELTGVEQIISPQAAEFVKRLAVLPSELQKDPNVLYQEAARLAVSLDASLSIEAINQANNFIKKTINSIEDNIENRKKIDTTYARVLSKNEIIHSVTEIGMGGVVSSLPNFVYNEADPDTEIIIKDPELIQKLKEINYEFSVDPSLKNDTPRWKQLKKELIDLGKKNKDIDLQIKVAVGRIQDFIDTADYAHSGGAKQEWQAQVSHLGLSSVEADRIMDPNNPNGYQDVLDEILSIVESNPNAEWDHAVASIQYKLPGIQELLAYRFQQNPKFVEGAREWVGMEVGVRRLAHELSRIQTEGKFEDIHKFMGQIGNDDIDHLLRSTPFMSQAISAEDTALRSLISEISLRWDLLESEIQKEAQKTVNTPGIDKNSDAYKFASNAIADPDKENPGSFTDRHEIAKKLFADRLDDLLDWRMGKTIRPKDVQVSGERFHLLNKQMAICYRDALKTQGEKTADERKILDDEIYKKAYEDYGKICKSRGEDISVLRMTKEETDILSGPSGLAPIDRRAYETLKDSLTVQGLDIDEKTKGILIKSIINARNFHVITMHRQTIIAHLCELPPSNMGEAEWWISTPYEDTIRALNKRKWLEDRFRVGGASGEQYRILRAGYEPVRAGEVKGVAQYKKGKRLIDSATAIQYDTLIELRKRSGIDYEAIAQEDSFKIGGILDATTWRVKLGLLNKQLLDDYAVDGTAKGVKIDENQGLAFQIQDSDVGSQKRQDLMRKLFAKDPIVAMHYFPKEMQQVLKDSGVSDADLPKTWSTIQRALSIFEQKTTYDEKYKYKKGFTTDITKASKDIALYTEPDLLPEILKTIGVDEGEKERYTNLIKKIADHAVSPEFVKDMASLPMPFVLTISDIDWSKADFSCLGSAAQNRRQRDIGGALMAEGAELKMADDPSPLNSEDFWKNIKEVQVGMQQYLGKENPNTNARIYANLYAYLEYNRNQLEWIPGATWISQQLPVSFSEAINKAYHGKRAFPYASHAQSRKGPHAPALDVFQRNFIIDVARRRELLTDLLMYDKLKNDQRAHLGWQTLYFLRWATPLLISSVVFLAAKTALEEEKKS